MTAVRHATGVAFEAPDGWEVLDGGPETVIALEPDDGRGFRANLVLTVVDNDGLSFRDWQAATDVMLPETLPDYLVLDLERRDVAGLPGGRRLAHHLAQNGDALVMEQWFTVWDGRGCTLTATVDVLRYAAAADTFEGCADTLLLPEVSS